MFPPSPKLPENEKNSEPDCFDMPLRRADPKKPGITCCVAKGDTFIR